MDGLEGSSLPVECWKMVRDILPAIDTDSTVKNNKDFIDKLRKVMIACKEHIFLCVPQYFKPREKYLESLPHYIDFTKGFLEYFVKILRREDLSELHSLCLDTHNSVLHHLTEKNQQIYINIVKKYFELLNDLISERAKEKNNDINHFTVVRFKSSINFELSAVNETTPIINTNSSLRITDFTIILKIIRSQFNNFNRCSPWSLNPLWAIILDCGEEEDLLIQVDVLRTLASMITNLGYPYSYETTTKLFTFIEGIIRWLMMNYKGDCSSDTSVSLIFKYLCKIFDALIERNDLSIEYDVVLKVTLTTLTYDSPFLHTEMASQSTCKLIQFLLETAKRKVYLEERLKSLTPLLRYCNPLLLIFYHVIYEDYLSTRVHKKRLKISHNDNSKRSYVGTSLEITSVTSTLLKKEVMKCFEEIKASQKSKKSCLKIFQFLVMYFKMLAELRLKIEQHFFPVHFLDETFLKSLVNMILNLHMRECKKNELLSIIQICQFVLFLPEVANMTNNILRNILFFLFIPWIKEIHSISHLLHETTFQQAAQNSLFQDVDIMESCLKAFSFIQGNYALRYSLTVLKKVMSNSQLISTALKCLPYIISNCTVEDSSSIAFDILVSAFESTDTDVHLILSQLVPLTVCALSGSCIVVKTTVSEEEFVLKCKLCDNGLKLESDRNKNSAALLPIVKQYINLSKSTAAVRENMAKSLHRLTNHLQDLNCPELFNEILHFIDDEDHEVRMAFSKVAPLIFTMENIQHSNVIHSKDKGKEAELQKNINRFIDLAFITVVKSLKSHEKKTMLLQFSVMSTIYNIGCMPVHDILLPVIKMFILLISHPNMTHLPVAQSYLKEIASSHKQTIQDLFYRLQDEICQVLVTTLVYNFISDSSKVPERLMIVARAFGFPTAKELIECTFEDHILKYLLPWIVKKPHVEELLYIVGGAAYKRTNISNCIKNSFQNIYPHVFLFESDTVVYKVSKMISDLTQTEKKSLVYCSFKVIICELLFFIHKKKNRIIEALIEMKKLEIESERERLTKLLMECRSPSDREKIKSELNKNVQEERKSLKSNKDVANFIQPRFLGVLAFLDGKLVSSSGCESIKKNALLALPELIKLMGPDHITPVRFKVLATLRSALNLYKDCFPQLIFSAFLSYVQNVEPVALGPLMSTIFVCLLPSLDQFPIEIASVFNILVIKNSSSVTSHLHDLHFVPDLPPTHDVYTLVQKKLAQIRGAPVKEQLEIIVRQASHENIEVRLLGLKKLREELSLLRQEIAGFIFENDKMDNLIMQLLDLLIAGSRDHKDDILLACGECLGEFGALDPGHLPNKISLKVDDKEVPLIESDIFVTRALKELVRALQAANHTVIMDRFALAIQELLKIYDIPKSRKNVWNNLSESMKEIIAPLFNTRYFNRPQKDSNSQSLIPHPIFGNLKKCDWQTWAFHWVSKLITYVTNEMAAKVFTYCKFGFKNDMQTLLFFLPYILLYAILSTTENERKFIIEEINAVFRTKDKPNLRENFTERKIKNIYHSLDEDKTIFKDFLRTNQLCVKTIFELFDFLNQWTRQMKTMTYRDRTSVPNIQNVEEFLNSFSKWEMAQVAFAGKDHTRALLYMEEHVHEKPHMLQEELPIFGKIYSALNDPDSYKGIIDIHETEPTAQEMILYHEVTNQLQDAAACYEHLSQEEIKNEGFHKAMVQCYLGMDQPATALHVADGLLSSWEDNSPDLLDEQAEAMFRLSKYDELEDLLSKKHMTQNSGWGVRLGQSLLHLRKGDGQQMLSEVNSLRIELVRALGTTSITECEYKQGYDNIVKLHILNEFEKLGNMILKVRNIEGPRAGGELINQFKQLVEEELTDRLKLLHPSCRVLHPVLSIRRVVLSLAHQMLEPHCPTIGDFIMKEIGRIWLKTMEITRKSNSFQQAYSNILTAENYKPKGLFIEKAKLLWSKSEPDAALSTLTRGIEHHFPDASTFKTLPEAVRQEDRKICAEAKLLIATYNDENVNKDLDKNLAIYRDAVDAYKFWEKSIVCLAQYEYKVLRAITDTDCSSRVQDLQSRVINHFGKSLEYGCEYIYQSMPRMLSVWLDYGAQLAQEIKPDRISSDDLAKKKAHMLKLTEIIDCYVKRLPTYIFMTAFSQLISRICHPLPECFLMLKNIIARIIVAYPQQSLWMFISVYKSKFIFRKNRCEEVLRYNEIQKRPELYRLIKDFQELAEKLYDLANKNTGTDKACSYSIKKFYSPLYEIVTNPNLSSILIPLQQFRTITLPRSMNAYKDHSPFPDDLVYICGMKEEVQILASLQKPKKIVLIGSDGKQHPVLCKPKDDIRLDARMMEFSSIINLYLHRDPEARNRSLHIRTYSAVPLTDDCGLIEWLPNLVGLRPIILKIYKEKGPMPPTNAEMNLIKAHKNDSLEKKLDSFVNKILPRHPPVLREWFLKEFHHPTAWYLARTAYVRTTAVMSIVGNILGLGDRHGENILLDLTCGDLIHVDFGCLFNKGEFFEYPERVPFRLTHNMVSAMGPTGVEGMFKLACEITTTIMRQQIDQLMSVLRPFLYDPLVTWNSKKSRDENSETTNEKAVEWIQNIENRLQGTLRRREKPLSIPLSVEGQVRCLIQEATNNENLCQMFLGWGPQL